MIEIIGVQPELTLCQLGSLLGLKLIPVVRKIKNVRVFREPASCMHVMVARDDDMAFFPDQGLTVEVFLGGITPDQYPIEAVIHLVVPVRGKPTINIALFLCCS